jgi:formylglycine-generating enzyme required for sulfatase activity
MRAIGQTDAAQLVQRQAEHDEEHHVAAVPFDWVPIPAGTVHRGTPAAEIADVVRRHADLALPRRYFAKEAPRAEISVPAFEILRVPVTRAQWNGFAADEPNVAPAPPGDPDFPVDGVSWADATRFADWVAGRTGEPIALPTEIQWERAARGDDAREYPWGDDWDPQAANTAALGVGDYLPVGSLPRGASPFGVLDLAGNVDEWTRDRYAPYDGAPADVPPVESWANDPHVTRGGSFRQDRDLSRCARRHGLYDSYRGAGLRLVREHR